MVLREKDFWVQQIFMERHSKGDCHVMVNKMKLFDHEFLFKHLVTQHFDFLTVMFDSVCFVF